MITFYLATAVLALVVVGVMLSAYAKSKDPLHPAFVLGPMFLFLYVGMPLNMLRGDGFFGYLTEAQAGFAQMVNALGAGSFMLGLVLSAVGGNYVKGRSAVLVGRNRFADAGVVVGSAGLVGYAAGILSVGGFSEAYGRGYGGGWSDSGYVRELFLLTVPAILLMMLSGEASKRKNFWVWVVAFSAPLAIQGLLGGRRGPTFVVAVTVVAGLYVIRGTRPSVLRVLGGGAMLGLLLLFLVANRDKIYIGSDFKFEGDVGEFVGAGAGNEFIYGAGTIVAADATDSFYWGGRYATVLFIRPIPRSVWPEKYEFARQIFGADVEKNMGVDYVGMAHVLGWVGAFGAAPGIVADMFLEFSWFCVFVLAGLGAIYGWAWRMAVNRGGLWTVYYAVLLSLSLYLVMQTLEAALFRALFMIVPVWLADRVARLDAAAPRPAEAR